MSDNSDVPALFQQISDADKLHQLIDSVLNHGTQPNPLRSHWEELKTDESKRLTIEIFSLGSPWREGSLDRAMLIISFESPTYHAMWKQCLAIAFEKLDILEASMDADPDMDLTIQIPTQAVERLFEFLKPLAQKTHMESVQICEMVHIHPLSHFLANNSVREIVLDLWYTRVEHLKAFIEIVEIVKPLCVRYSLHDYMIRLEGFADFLRQLAGLVECILQDSYVGRGLPKPIAVAKIMLKRKCKCVVQKGQIESDKEISISEAEKIVKYLHRLNKKVSLTMATRENLMTVQVGEYRIEVYDGVDSRLMEIEHIDMSPKAREIFPNS